MELDWALLTVDLAAYLAGPGLNHNSLKRGKG